MTRYQKFFIAFIFIYISLGSHAQDPFFSQVDMFKPYVNPANGFNALATDIKLKLELQFRDQWNNIEMGDDYATSMVNAEYNFYKSNVDSWNAGLLFLSDRSNTGYLKQTSFQTFTSYSRKLSGNRRGINGSHVLTLGASFGLGQTNVDLSNLWFGRQYDLSTFSPDLGADSGEPIIRDNASYIDLNLGGRWIYYNTDKIFTTLGIAVSHVNQPGLSASDETIKYASRLNVHLAKQMQLGKSMYHKPSLTYIQQDWAYQFLPAYKLIFDLNNQDEDFSLESGFAARIVHGLESTIMDAFIFYLGLGASKWHLDFSFDLNTSTLRPATNGIGALELGIRYNILNDN